MIKLSVNCKPFKAPASTTQVFEIYGMDGKIVTCGHVFSNGEEASLHFSLAEKHYARLDETGRLIIAPIGNQPVL